MTDSSSNANKTRTPQRIQVRLGSVTSDSVAAIIDMILQAGADPKNCSIEVEREDYSDYQSAILYHFRLETDEEMKIRERQEAQAKIMQLERERAYFERLRAKFEPSKGE